jgi:transcriptional regulator with XRE-family HTH domain
MPKRITSKHRKSYTPTFVRQWRVSKGLSLDELVAMVSERVESFSKSSLSRIETGKQGYTQETLEALAVCLKCRPFHLLIVNPLDTNNAWSIWESLRIEDRQAIITRFAEGAGAAALPERPHLFGSAEQDEHLPEVAPPLKKQSRASSKAALKRERRT